MGNKIGRRRQAVDERYTRPQGLYLHKDVDHKKLRRLILDSKLAPCYPGDEDSALDLEECPICFLYYPSLNRSRCCTKGICTECFLQMKPPHSARPTQCPFCKTSNYAVEYRGVRTKEEKGMEQLEEQKVIEAQIRMRRQELQEEEERKQKRKEVQEEEERKQMRTSLSNRIAVPADVDHCDIGSSSLSVPSFTYPPQADEFASSQGSCTVPVSTRHSHLRQNREDNFDMDLEDIMVMEAIWLSIQDHGAHGNPACCGNSALPGPSFSEECYNSHALVPLEPSPGQLACAAAALAERQHMNNGLSMAGSTTSAFDMSHRSAGLPVGENHVMNYPSYPPENWIEVPPENGRAGVPREDGEWAMENRSDMAEAGTSYASSDIAADALQAASPLQEGANLAVGHHLVPESFEEQMMLAMAVSLAEARARTNPQGVTWL